MDNDSSAPPHPSDELDDNQVPVKPSQLRKFTERLAPGKTEYQVRHNFRTEDVIVQTRIANRVREGGIAIEDENTVRIFFGGVLNEPLDVIIIG